MSSLGPHIACRVLSLDGGGAKGFYTLGILEELEALLGGRPLFEQFELIFGTSTGGIIAALLALGRSTAEVHALYRKHVPTVMQPKSAKAKSAALETLAKEIFPTETFKDVKTGVGIVATRWDFERPMIFKGSVMQAHGQTSTFVPGFGCTIADAVRASCSAYPYFERPILTTDRGEQVELFDGGYSANNPTLFAIADAIMALKHPMESVRVISLGVGMYPEPRRLTSWLKALVAKPLIDVQLIQKTLNVNTTSMEQLTNIFFKGAIPIVRINDTFHQPEMATDFLESDMAKLDTLYQRGRQSFAKHEAEIKTVLNIA
jgi:patatin-like phospholipase/acyl hydrolase